MVLLCHLDLGEKVAVQFEGRRQVIQRLLEVAVLEVCFAQLRVCRHQDEQVLLVDVDEQLAERELLDAHLDDSIGVLAHSELI